MAEALGFEPRSQGFGDLNNSRYTTPLLVLGEGFEPTTTVYRSAVLQTKLPKV